VTDPVSAPTPAPAPAPAQAAAPAPAPYEPAAVAPPTKKRRNVLAIVAFVITIIAILVPFGFVVGGLVSSIPDQDPNIDPGWNVISAVIFFVYGIAFSGPVAILGLVLAVISLFLRNRKKVLAVVTTVLAAILSLVGIPFLPNLISIWFP
jgi:hypothetical protein